ncbi:hypothetical protein KIN20_005819 [Parelaphostrongylus tenuis]|uniref:Enoyl-CoA hydratase domain-containing protein 3, mitochondrial n=1 Tax=Parelaphostrongylus tenuis TaxID=148309 RepID=A0AAD5M0Q8_PARTN|nr:hypothetical protein KIN20_005819 [Parelaphostrongylus tenuis]
MFLLRRSFCSGLSLLGKELYQGESVVRLVLKDAKRHNALSLAMIDELIKELEELNNMSKVRSVIIASGSKVFSSGHDLNELEYSKHHNSAKCIENTINFLSHLFDNLNTTYIKLFRKADAGEGLHRQIFERSHHLMMLIRRMQIPVIAEVNGAAVAAGCQLVAACDVVVASETSKFLVPGQKVGLFCSTPGIPLARAVPHKIALDMLLTAEPIDAHAALSYGLVSRVVPDSEVKFEALKVAEQIGRHSRSVTALGKAFFYSQTELGLNDAYRHGGKVMTENLKLKDTQEGIKAFIEKRKPDFTHTDEKH